MSLNIAKHILEITQLILGSLMMEKYCLITEIQINV